MKCKDSKGKEKKCYANGGEARQKIRAIMIARRNDRYNTQYKSILRPYDCTKCDWWHLTSQSRRIQSGVRFVLNGKQL